MRNSWGAGPIARVQRPAWTSLALVAVAAGVVSCGHEVPVDRLPAGGTVDAWLDPGVDAMPGMDNNAKLTPAEIRGRNTWVLWTAGNEKFWDWLSRNGYGSTDLLMTIDSRRRDTRFKDLGLINDPNLRKATKPDSLGLWIDDVVTPEPAAIRPEVYGRPSGIMGLRIYPNPEFTCTSASCAAARKNWDTTLYYDKTKSYGTSKTLVRPYIVGMACGFCHVGPHPLNPPADPEHPKWENLSATIGSQYFKMAPIFAPRMGPGNFLYQVLLGARDGTLDTSLIPSDQIYNPSNMNAIYEIAGRMAVVRQDSLSAANMLTVGPPAQQKVMHVLKDGGDNIGVIGALSRVFVNIGEYHQQWILNHQPILGARAQTPFPVAGAFANSDYWNVTAKRVPDIVTYFEKVGGAMHLADAPGGKAYLTKDAAVLTVGRTAFADNCARCHSSKRPPAGMDDESDSARAWFRRSVNAADFRDGNYLSTDERLPDTDVGTNVCRAVATNAVRGHVWGDFSSETYKDGESVGTMKIWDKYKKDSVDFALPGGGRGFYRPASLVSAWATAPFFHNNALGITTDDPSVAGRMRAFDDAATKLLWPEKRLGEASIKITTDSSYLIASSQDLPWWLRWVADSGKLKLGPIPAGTPVGLLASASFHLSASPSYAFKVIGLVRQALKDLHTINTESVVSDSARRELLRRKLAPALLSISNCPDLVEDQGHYYGTKLTDAEKKALIEYLKTL